MRIVIAVLAILSVSACASPPVNRNSAAPLETVSSVDLDRYLGRWYEIARLENGFEKNCEGVTADYSMREDGLIEVLNTCREGAPDGKARAARGRARVVDAATRSKLEVSFFGPFWGDYWIIDLTGEYSRSIVGEPSGRYLWILSRTPAISEDSRLEALGKLQALGYETSALYFTRQPPSPDDPPAE
ncbi:MAG: lipocalin family protein [Pseudomonadota bacterium]